MAALAASESTTVHPDCATTVFSTLATNPNLALCMIKSNIPIITLMEPPSSDQLAMICKTAPCRELIQLFIDMDPVECTLTFDSHVLLRSDLINRTTQECASLGRPLQSKTKVDNETTTAHQSAARPGTQRIRQLLVALAGFSVIAWALF